MHWGEIFRMSDACKTLLEQFFIAARLLNHHGDRACGWAFNDWMADDVAFIHCGTSASCDDQENKNGESSVHSVLHTKLVADRREAARGPDVRKGALPGALLLAPLLCLGDLIEGLQLDLLVLQHDLLGANATLEILNRLHVT